MLYGGQSTAKHGTEPGSKWLLGCVDGARASAQHSRASHAGWACCEPKYNATICVGRGPRSHVPDAVRHVGHPPTRQAGRGLRLGMAAFNSVDGGAGSITGPTLQSCGVAGDQLKVQFNESLLRGLVLRSLPRAPAHSCLCKPMPHSSVWKLGVWSM